MDTPHLSSEGPGEARGFGGGGQGEETTEAAAQDAGLQGGPQDDGISRGDFLHPLTGGAKNTPFVADRDQYMGPFRCPPPSSTVSMQSDNSAPHYTDISAPQSPARSPMDT